MANLHEDTFGVLPPDILHRVVSLLPPAPLFRCRAVCKQWNAWMSELRPQTPDQKIVVVIVPIVPNTIQPPPSDHYWVALDTSMDKWYKIDSSQFLNFGPYVGKRCTVLAGHEGLLCIRVDAPHRMQALLVLNLVTKEYKEIPHFHWSTHTLVVDNNTNDFKLYAINKKLVWQDSEFVVEVYDSNDGVWRALCVIPSMGDCTPLSFPYTIHMAVYGDFVHVLVNFHNHFHYIFTYNMEEDSWVRHGGSKLPFFMRLKDALNLLTNGSQLLLVGEMFEFPGFPSRKLHSRIFIWDVSLGRNNGLFIAEMPPSLVTIFNIDVDTVGYCKLCVCGYGDRIFFLQESSCKVVIYNISEDSWHCPTNMVGTRATLPEFVRHAPFEKFMTLPFSL